MAIDGKPLGQIAETLVANDTKMASLKDLSGEIQEKYSKGLMEAFELGVKAFPKLNFFIVALATKDPMFDNLWKHKKGVIGMCPPPNYDQSVFRFNQETGNLEHLWTIPDRNLCIGMMEDKALVAIEEWPLLANVVKFADGTLSKWRDEFNKEQVELGLKLASVIASEKNIQANATPSKTSQAMY
jgi:hypothetical protein